MEMLQVSILISLVSFSFKNVLCNTDAKVEMDNETLFLERKYMEMDNGIKYWTQKSLKGLLSVVIEASEHVNLSSECNENILRLTAGVRNLKQWAISFPDASGKLVDGLISGNSHMLGNYDQCLASVAKKKNGDISFHGRYCLITYKPYLPDSRITLEKDQIAKVFVASKNVSEVLKFYLMKSQLMRYYSDNYGLCVPSGCDRKDVEKATKYAGEIFYLNLTVQYCHVEADTPKLDIRKIVIICIFATFGLLNAIGTLTDYYSKERNLQIKHPVAKFLLFFSIMTNFPRLFNTATSEKALSCLSGIRVLTIFYILLGHLYISKSLFYLSTNVLPYFFSYIPSFFTQIVLNGFLCVDIFFFIGGFINCYIRKKEKDMGKSPSSTLMIVLHRLWRIYPTYIFSILLVFLLNARGPLGPKLEKEYIEKCATEWWKNMLFINNFFIQENMCLIPSWYLACDMQYFLISLVTIPLLLKYPIRGCLVNCAVILGGLISTSLWVRLNKIPPTVLFTNVSRKETASAVAAYVAPFTHISPYFLGILMGYFFSSKKGLKIPKVYQVLGWLTAGLLFTSMLFMTLRWNSGKEYTFAESALYFSFSRPLYSLAVAWIIFCCITGHGGIINYILSFKMWIPLSRITYALYLVSLPIQIFYQANLRTPTDAHIMILIWEYFGDLCVSCLLALALTILVESPLLSLGKEIFRKEASEEKIQNAKQESVKENYPKGSTVLEIITERGKLDTET